MCIKICALKDLVHRAKSHVGGGELGRGFHGRAVKWKSLQRQLNRFFPVSQVYMCSGAGGHFEEAPISRSGAQEVIAAIGAARVLLCC